MVISDYMTLNRTVWGRRPAHGFRFRLNGKLKRPEPMNRNHEESVMSNDDTGDTEEDNDEPEHGEETQLDGHDTVSWQSDDCPPEVLAQFWSSVAAYGK
jgi:hypothetical protein